MAFLDNTSVTVDAILTKKGRELLAAGSVDFNITQFAVADDEVDYTLWNPNALGGTDYFGSVIQNMPVLEAFPDETQSMRFKLITLPKNTSKIPAISVPGQTSFVLTAITQVVPVNPITLNVTNGNATLGYTAILSNGTWFDLQVTTPVANSPSIPSYIGDIQNNQTITKSGLAFSVVPKSIPTNVQGTQSATLTIIGNETGGQTILAFAIVSPTTAAQQTQTLQTA